MPANYWTVVGENYLREGLDHDLAFHGCSGRHLGRRAWETINQFSDRVIRAHVEDWLRNPVPGSATDSIVQIPPELRPSVDDFNADMLLLIQKPKLKVVSRASRRFMEIQAMLHPAAFPCVGGHFVCTAGEAFVETIQRRLSLHYRPLRANLGGDVVEGALILSLE
jgi:hypothetical protein